MSQEPFSFDKSIRQQAEEETKRKRDDRLRRYKRVFGSADGKFVLEDLKKLFGYGLPCVTYGCTLGDAGLRSGMVQPIQHIINLTAAEMRPEPKPTKAQSGHTE